MKGIVALAAFVVVGATVMIAHAQPAEPTPEDVEHIREVKERYAGMLENVLCPSPQYATGPNGRYVYGEDPDGYILRIDGRDLPACSAVRYLDPPDGAMRTTRGCGNAPWAGESSCVTRQEPVPSMADEIDGYVDRLYRWTRPAAILSDGNYRLTLGELQPFLLHDDDVPWRQAPLHKSHAVLYEPQAFRLTIPDLRVVIVITPQLLRLTDTPSMLVTVHPF